MHHYHGRNASWKEAKERIPQTLDIAYDSEILRRFGICEIDGNGERGVTLLIDPEAKGGSIQIPDGVLAFVCRPRGGYVRVLLFIDERALKCPSRVIQAIARTVKLRGARK